MLSNRGKMVVISSTTNEWPQNQIDEKNLMASSRFMEKVPGQEPPQQQQPLKCPRCDSSNTKFCYYNNYSQSQPRHFCKACKRYWTRGGTLRNVPVGGGCRKNKRVKRPAASNSIDGSSSSTTIAAAKPNAHTQPQIYINPFLYGSSTNPSDMNLPFSRFNSIVSSSVDTISGYDLQPQLNALGLGFSSGFIMSNDAGDGNYRNGFNQTSTNSLLSSYPNFGSSSSPTMASLLASTLHHQQKFINGGIKSTQAPTHFNNLTSFEDLQMTGIGEAARIGVKEVKSEEGQNRMDWNQMEQIGLADPTLYWSTNSVSAWHDVTSLI